MTQSKMAAPSAIQSNVVDLSVLETNVHQYVLVVGCSCLFCQTFKQGKRKSTQRRNQVNPVTIFLVPLRVIPSNSLFLAFLLQNDQSFVVINDILVSAGLRWRKLHNPTRQLWRTEKHETLEGLLSNAINNQKHYVTFDLN